MKGEDSGSIELFIAEHRKMLIRLMLRKALTHQGASLQTLSGGCELQLAKTGEGKGELCQDVSPVTL